MFAGQLGAAGLVGEGAPGAAHRIEHGAFAHGRVIDVARRYAAIDVEVAGGIFGRERVRGKVLRMFRPDIVETAIGLVDGHLAALVEPAQKFVELFEGNGTFEHRRTVAEGRTTS